MRLTTQGAEAKGRLIDAISAIPELSDVDVAYSFHGNLAIEHVYLGDIEIADTEPKHLTPGRKVREENFEIPVVIKTGTYAMDARESEARAGEIAGHIEDLIADDPHILNDEATNGIRWCLVSAYEMANYPLETGYESYIMLTVTVRTRLT